MHASRPMRRRSFAVKEVGSGGYRSVLKVFEMNRKQYPGTSRLARIGNRNV